MLSEHPIDVVLLVKDLEHAREFYGEKLQLAIVVEDESTISFATGGTRLKASKSTTGTKDTQTQASWRVDDLEAEVAWLRERGVEPEEYDTDEITTVNGIADQGSAWVAWITDPDGNVLGIEQAK
jgi:predicted enzyme related to lactoylglutathione lyase